MKKFLVATTMVIFTASLAVSPASAKKKYSKVKGHVVKVEQQVKTANGGEYDRLTIRTRNGDLLELNLGNGGACDGCYQAGDQIRARTGSTNRSGGPQSAQSIQVRRNGKTIGYTNSNGKMVESSNQRRANAGGGGQVRDRSHKPESAACRGCDSGQRSEAGRQSGGGSRGRGGN